MPKVKALRTIYTGGKLIKKGETFTVPDHKLKDFTDKQIEKMDSGFKNRKTKGEKDLSDKTVAELTDIAKDVGLEGYSTMNKAELVKALKSKL